MKNILITGGLGYIASHTATVLVKAGYNIVLYDNLSNSNINVIKQLTTIMGSRPMFVKGDIRDTALLLATLTTNNIHAVLHFAGLKAVGESVNIPIEYFDNNVGGTISLLKAMQQAKVFSLVFSSSATVYGSPKYLPFDEEHPTNATNPYGRSKLHIEEILSDTAAANPFWRIVSLRYFNPVGAHESGLIGENPAGVANNLMPFVARVASGLLPEVCVFGNDYDTHDGTGVRDYIHVMDLATGHTAALNYLQKQTGWQAINLGTGRGYSVLEMIAAFAKSSQKNIPYSVAARRIGDIAACFAEVKKAKALLNWQATLDLSAMCDTQWHFQQKLSA